MPQLHDHPLRQIRHTGIDRTRRRVVVMVRLRERHQLAVSHGVRRRHVGRGHQFRRARVGMGHSERREDPLPHELLPALAGDPRDHLPRHQVEQVVVRIPAAEARCRPQVADVPDDFVAREIGSGPEHQVARAQSEPAAMHQQVADGHLVSHIGVVHLELGHVVDHPVVPTDLPLVHQHRERRRGERLGIRRNAEQRFRRHRRRLPQLANPIALRQHDAAVLHHRHRDPRDVELAPRPLHRAVHVVLRRGGKRAQQQ